MESKRKTRMPLMNMLPILVVLVVLAVMYDMQRSLSNTFEIPVLVHVEHADPPSHSEGAMDLLSLNRIAAYQEAQSYYEGMTSVTTTTTGAPTSTSAIGPLNKKRNRVAAQELAANSRMEAHMRK